MGGLGAAHELSRDGLADVTVLEKAGDIGGVWRENTYPGAACDVPSHLYCYSFARKTDWGRRYAEQPDILGYIHDRRPVRPSRLGADRARGHVRHLRRRQRDLAGGDFVW